MDDRGRIEGWRESGQGGGGGRVERGEERRGSGGNNADHNNTPVNHNSGWAGIMISADFIMIAVKFGNLAFSIKASKRGGARWKQK